MASEYNSIRPPMTPEELGKVLEGFGVDFARIAIAMADMQVQHRQDQETIAQAKQLLDQCLGCFAKLETDVELEDKITQFLK